MLQNWLIVIRMCRSVASGLLISVLHLAKYSTSIQYTIHAVSEYVLPTLWLCKCIWKALQLMWMSASGTVWAMQWKCRGLFYTFLYITMVMTDWPIYWQLMAIQRTEMGDIWGSLRIWISEKVSRLKDRDYRLSLLCCDFTMITSFIQHIVCC